MFLVIYLIEIKFIITKFLDRNNKLEKLIQLYENGIYKENHI